ncbi:MAG: trypsin-like peptidase domain-containing protein [Euryarchaeota archaeon]|nr:trypsin-like peptidase domain-containing protein [Euryarchaeota archaeon]MDE1836058.1 trypsin-like peptidase domain-containing protein [Euryarchaeota archaeon]MDE2044036.1 trypsin-like peptidase domain-containing protein [Thermoplasmata archaeon]
MALSVLEDEITNAVERLSEHVVSINSQRILAHPRRGIVPMEGSGSGVILEKEGLIVTNHHVIDGATHVRVTLHDGREFQGEVVGTDPQTDVAVLKVDAGVLGPATLGDSEKLKVGQIVLAIGNTLGLPGGPTVSTGVVSALGRPMPWSQFIFEGLIQTDAAINPGNSGGPLADRHGNVIGINTAMVPFAHGIGFSVPINTVRWVAEQITKYGRVIRPFLGIVGVTVTPTLARVHDLKSDRGILIVGVEPHTAASRAGIRAGDILTRIGERNVDSMKDLLEALSKSGIGSDAPLAYRRGRNEQWTQIRLEESPEEAR